MFGLGKHSPHNQPLKLLRLAKETMARRPTIQDLDEFDDDTDLPLPSRSLPNTGTRGAILEQISDDESSDQEDDDAEDFQPQLSSTSQPRPPVNIPLPTQIPGGPVLVTDVTPYKKSALLTSFLSLG
jgi:signal recognition particle subunit SRP19